jgi:hypothetical protein
MTTRHTSALLLTSLGYLVPASVLARGWSVGAITAHGDGSAVLLGAGVAMVTLCGAAALITRETADPAGYRTLLRGVHVIALVGVAVPTVLALTGLVLILASFGRRA